MSMATTNSKEQSKASQVEHASRESANESTQAALETQARESSAPATGAESDSIIAKVTELISTDQTQAAAAVISATQAQKAAIANDSNLMTSLMNLELEHRKCALDALYTSVKDVEILKKMIEHRFGVPVGKSNISAKADAVGGEYGKDLKDHLDAVTKSDNNRSSSVASGDDAAWTLNGLIHVYKVYCLLPQCDINKAQGLMTFNTSLEYGCGGAYTSYQLYYVDYSDNTELDAFDKLNPINYTGKFAPDDSYTRTDLVCTDVTVAHELGHIVDAAAPGGPYSEQFESNGNAKEKSFPSVNKWKKHELSSLGVSKLYSDIKGCLDDPYKTLSGAELNDFQQSIVDDIAKYCLNLDGDIARTDIDKALSELKKGYSLEDMQKESNAKSAINDKKWYYDYYVKKCNSLAPDDPSAKFYQGKLAEYKKIYDDAESAYAQATADKIKNAKDSGRDEQMKAVSEEQFEDCKDTAILSHILRAQCRNGNPWAYENYSNLPKRQIHRDYLSKNWFSYPNESRAGTKISTYQFTNPGEDFAETYGSYYVSGGKSTPQPLREWFEANCIRTPEEIKAGETNMLDKISGAAYNKKADTTSTSTGTTTTQTVNTSEVDKLITNLKEAIAHIDQLIQTGVGNVKKAKSLRDDAQQYLETAQAYLSKVQTYNASNKTKDANKALNNAKKYVNKGVAAADKALAKLQS